MVVLEFEKPLVEIQEKIKELKEAINKEKNMTERFRISLHFLAFIRKYINPTSVF